MSKLKRIVFYILFLFSLFSVEKTFAQGTSNKGTDFWVGYGTHIATGNMVLYLTSDVNTTATVSINALGSTQIVNITANIVSTVTIPSTAHLSVEGKSALGIHITSLKPIIVYSHIYASSVSGATLVLPTNTLGKDYFSINYKQVSNQNNSASWFFVVAVEDNTQVEITPSQATQGGWVANTKYTVNLNKGEIYHVLGAYTNANGTLGVDLTGSKIKSVSTTGVCKKVAVFSGSSKISISCLNNNTAGSADNLFQQVYPTATWGKKFITVPQKERNFDVYRILKSDPTAVVTLNGLVIPNASFTNGLYYDFESQAVNNISSDKAIQVVQYAVTQGRGINCTPITGDVGDPEMIFLNPLEQTLTQITMYSSPNFNILKHFINVVVKNEGVASFKVDGVSKSTSFIPVVGNAAYYSAQISVAAGTHNLSCDEGFNAIAYGFGGAESYGYAAGANLTAFGVETIDDVTKQVLQSACAATPFSLSLKLPYQPVEIYLDKGDGTGSISIPIELLSQTTKDGETTYVYSLAKSLIFTLPNTYPFKVRVIKPTIDDCGTGDEFNFDLIINPKPVANFNTIAKSCLREAVNFTSQADPNEPNISNYLWDFNGEGSATTKDASFIFLTSGLKKVRFSVKSVSGCWSDVVEKEVNVVELPVPQFSAPLANCVNKDISFTDLSTTADGTIVKWDWNFNDPLSTTNTSNLQNPTHNYKTYAIYSVRLTVTTSTGCINTIIKEVIVYPEPVADFEASEVCVQAAPTAFTNKSTVLNNGNLSYLWDFNEPSSGINNTSTLKNPTHSYSVAGNYIVKLTVTSDAGCQIETTKTVRVNPKPLANFTAPAQSCFNDAITFTDVPEINGPIVTDYLWDFNGVGTSTLKNPQFTFPTTGIKTIRYSVKSDKGCWSDITSKNIEVMALPISDFSFSTITCVNRDISFTDQSTTIGQTIVKWEWDFGDPTSTSNLSNLQNPNHIFSAVKIYDIKLTVTTNLGCTKTIIKQINIYPLPVVNFDTPDICLDDASAQFTNKTTVADGSALTYIWDFGDPSSGILNSSTLVNPSHKYSSAANYQVKLMVKSAKGCESQIIKTFTVNGSTPKADFVVQNGSNLCNDVPVVFEDRSLVDFGEITKIEWYYDSATPTVVEVDNNPNLRSATAKKYTHQYPVFFSPAQKIVNVKMLAYSGNSATCVSTVIKSITLKAVPIASFLMPDGCLPNGEAQFFSQSTFDGFSTGLTYVWDFGDTNTGLNNTSTLVNPTHLYKAAGDYLITLIVTAPNGCVATLSKTFTVKGAIPQPLFNVLNENALCSDYSVVFNEVSTLSFGELNKVEWYFDIDNQLNNPAYQLVDNSPTLRADVAKSYSFTYPTFNAPLNKIVNVKMKVFSGIGCVSEIIKSISLKAVPNVVFTSLPSVCEEVVPYQIIQAAENTGFAGSGVYSGKGVNSTGIFSPFIAGVGTHSITYTFTGNNGCLTEKKQDIIVYPTPTADAGLDQTILIGGEIKINATASGNTLTYKWLPATGLDGDDILTPIAKPIVDTKYTLLVTSADGCVYADEVFIKVLQYPEIPNTFTPNNDGVNDIWAIKYLESYPSSSIKIFNRYGQEVFKADNYLNPWDGRAAGVDLPPGMYYYIITANAGQLKYSGSVMLVR
ncbi:PKD domain-containing protein [Pedobacter cryophilus]|uniref:PKD domain-containing protein n=1 Tax=Pedobacter cryophilus TaxID=2571271 RepID=A0A4U1C3U6_9SPHI|nr:PKD domain-containing protein [Pedobacter cryophilus]TKB99006.1 PKD domain-containing protein [Pedobacter cryophilus]